MKKLFTLLILLCAVVTAKAVTIYVKDNNHSTLKVHSWIPGGAGTTWPGEAMSKKYDGNGNVWFLYTIPTGRTKFIVNCDASPQTADIDVPANDTAYDFSTFPSGTTPTSTTIPSALYDYYPWTLVGDKEIVGADGWDVSKTTNDMSTTDGTNYTITLTNLPLFKGHKYSIKVVKNHSWDIAQFPSDGNYEFSVSETAIYSVTVSFHEWEMNVSPSKTGDVDSKYIVAGGKMGDGDVSIWTEGVFNNDASGFVGANWSTINYNNKLTATDEDHKWSKTYSNVPAGTYAFKVVYDNDWGKAYPGNNYCFTLEDASNVTILFNDDTQAVQVKIGDTYDGNWSVVGDEDLLGVDWNTAATSTNMQTTDNLNYYFYSCKYLKAGTYRYKILKNHNSAYKIAYPENDGEISISRDGYYFIAIKYGPEPKWIWTGDTKPTLERLSAWTDGHSTYDSENDQTSFTPEAANEGIGFWIGNESTISADFLIFQTDEASKFQVNVQYVGENEGQIYTSENPQTDYIIPLDANKKIVKVNLIQAGDKEENVTFTKFYFADAVAKAELKTAAGGYATFSSDNAVGIPPGITAKYPSEVTSAGVIKWETFANGIPANQGALLEGTAGTTYKFPPAVGSPDGVPDEAKTTVTMEPIASKDLLQQENNGYTKYILSKQSPNSDVVGFFQVNDNGSWVNEGTAYLKVSNEAFSATTPAPAFFPLTGETTAIDNLTTEPAAKGEEKIYSLDGRRIVGQPTAKGIYIVNGKKLLKK